jgi:hypothetical protein
MSASAFKTAICNRAGVLIDCSKLKVDVQNPGTFAGIDLNVPRDPNTKELNVTENYPTTHGGDIVVVRAYYKWPVIVSRLMGSSLGDEPDGSHLLVSTAAFRNEPFSW